MVAYFTMHTYGANQAFRFAKGIWLHRESRQNRIEIGKDLFYIMYAASSELPSYVSTMGYFIFLQCIYSSTTVTGTLDFFNPY